MKEISLRKKRWSYVLLLSLVIYSTLYIVRPICTLLRNSIPFFDVGGNIMLAVTALIALAVIYKIKKRGGIKRNITFYSLAAAVLIYTVIIWQYKLAEEKIHFFEYGVLGFLIYRALIVDVRGFRVYIFTLILGFMLGWIDEIIQRMLPNRYYEFRDVMMNGVGVLMAIAIILIVNMDKHLFNKRHIN